MNLLENRNWFCQEFEKCNSFLIRVKRNVQLSFE